MNWQEVIQIFPFISELPEKDLALFRETVQYRQAEEGEFLLAPGEQCDGIPLVLSGMIRVFKLSENGREITLFRAGPGDTCLINIACQLEQEEFPAQAVVQEPCRFLIIPGGFYRTVLDHFMPWKDFLINMLYRRLSETMNVLEQVAFTRADKRLAQILCSMSTETDASISITHEQLAVELGTAREVVSRLLSEMKQKGLVSLGRNRIVLLDRDAIISLTR